MSSGFFSGSGSSGGFFSMLSVGGGLGGSGSGGSGGSLGSFDLNLINKLENNKIDFSLFMLNMGGFGGSFFGGSLSGGFS